MHHPTWTKTRSRDYKHAHTKPKCVAGDLKLDNTADTAGDKEIDSIADAVT